MIELRKITRRYRQGESPVIALNKVDLQIQDKAFVAIVGESGSGKSTLLHLLGGLDKPDEGEILVDGWSLTSASEREMTQYRRTRLGFVFQFFNLLPTLNVLENVCLPLQLQGRKKRRPGKGRLSFWRWSDFNIGFVILCINSVEVKCNGPRLPVH